MSQYNDFNDQLSKHRREQLVLGYNDFVEELIEHGHKPHFINFMFNHIPYGPKRRIEEMTYQVNRVHDILTRHTIRHTTNERWRHLRPIFIGAPDLPVWKHTKVTGRSLNMNGGLHFNVISLTAPPARSYMRIEFQNVLYGKQSRLNVPLERHFEQHSRFYVNDVLNRIHVTPITKGTMVDYALKTLKNGFISEDNMHILT